MNSEHLRRNSSMMKTLQPPRVLCVRCFSLNFGWVW